MYGDKLNSHSPKVGTIVFFLSTADTWVWVLFVYNFYLKWIYSFPVLLWYSFDYTSDVHWLQNSYQISVRVQVFEVHTQ